MSEDSRSELVRASPLGASLDEQECRELAKLVSVSDLGDDEVLLAEGHTDDTLHVVVNGALAVTREVGAGDWVSLHLLKRGDLAGAMGFIDGEPHSATLRAIGPTQVLSLRREQFEQLIESHPRVVYEVMRAIVRTVHEILLRMNLSHVELSNYITKQHGRY